MQEGGGYGESYWRMEECTAYGTGEKMLQLTIQYSKDEETLDSSEGRMVQQGAGHSGQYIQKQQVHLYSD